MLERTSRHARRRGLDQVETVEADVEALPFADGEFDLVVSFTGLHCFPRPAVAVKELARVLRPGGVITGSAFLTDSGLRHQAMRRAGQASGLMGPSGTGPDLLGWFDAAGFVDVELSRSGPIGYFRASRP
jgi:SAM-dependent methyltransferase